MYAGYVGVYVSFTYHVTGHFINRVFMTDVLFCSGYDRILPITTTITIVKSQIECRVVVFVSFTLFYNVSVLS